jgi:hypothetical protein
MDNAEKYHFSDFTHEHYKELLKIAKSKFTFIDYPISLNPPKSPCVLWRHDIDFSMQLALEMAQLENEVGIKSTYFILLHSEFYNLLDAADAKCVEQIIALGHSIGLHFDIHFYNVKEQDQLNEYLLVEKNLLEKTFHQAIKTFSFHKNNEFTMNCQEEYYAGMVNTYASVFQKDFGYASDSNGYWRFERLYDFLTTTKHQYIQVLTHPEWWTKEIMSPLQKVEKVLQQRTDRTLSWYVNTLKEYNRENIDW